MSEFVRIGVSYALIAPSFDETEDSYNKQLQRLDDFQTVADFRSCLHALPAAVTLGHKQCFHMMKENVRPEWYASPAMVYSDCVNSSYTIATPLSP